MNTRWTFLMFFTQKHDIANSHTTALDNQDTGENDRKRSKKNHHPSGSPHQNKPDQTAVKKIKDVKWDTP